MMRGLIQDWPLTIDRIIDHAAQVHGRREIVTRRWFLHEHVAPLAV